MLSRRYPLTASTHYSPDSHPATPCPDRSSRRPASHQFQSRLLLPSTHAPPIATRSPPAGTPAAPSHPSTAAPPSPPSPSCPGWPPNSPDPSPAQRLDSVP